MHIAFHITRWLVAASLIANLGLLGLFPQMTAWVEGGSRAVIAEQRTKCCCGTDDGRCCGLGCCVSRPAPAKAPCPCPQQKDTRDGQNGPLVLAFAQTLCGAGGETSRSRVGQPPNRVDRSLAGSSLQARHVRLDV